MPNIIDKVNINGTSYDIKDSISPASTITSNDIENWNNKVDQYSEYNGDSVTLHNESGLLYITAESENNNDTLSVELNPSLLSIHDVSSEVQLIEITPYNENGSVKIHKLAAPLYNSDAANKKYVDDSIATIDIPTVPSNVSAFNNDAGYIITESDPTVPAWAKAAQKPTYTASEVGAVPTSRTVNGKALTSNITLSASDVNAVATSAIGSANGVVPLNASSKIDESYLPSYVDDVIEGYYYNNKFWKESAHTTEITGEASKIYVDLTTDKTYRFGGTSFVEISSGTTVSVTRSLTSGTKVGTITINGTGTDLYAPTPPSKVSELSNDSGFITGISNTDVTTALGYTPYNSTNPNGYVNAAGASAAAPVQSVNGQTGAVTISDSDEKVKYVPLSSDDSNRYGILYAQNNGGSTSTTTAYTGGLGFTRSTGTLTIYRSDGGRAGTLSYKALGLKHDGSAYGGSLIIDSLTNNRTYTLPDKTGTIALTTDLPTVPSNISAFSNDAGYVTQSEAAAAAPVQSVNGKTGTVTLSAADVGALPSNTVIPTVVSTYASSGTDAVNGKAVYAALQTLDSSIAATTNQAISAITITDGKITASSKINIPTIPSNVSAFSNDAGYITLADLPIYDGTVITYAEGVNF